MSFTCPIPTTRVLGTYLINTIFGQCIMGKISGSTRLMDSKSVSSLSISHVATERVELHQRPRLLSTDEKVATERVELYHHSGLRRSDDVTTERIELHNHPGLLQIDEDLDSFKANETITEFSSFFRY